MAKNREKQKLNKAKGKEERLSLKNEWNISDPTAMLAVDEIIKEANK